MAQPTTEEIQEANGSTRFSRSETVNPPALRTAQSKDGDLDMLRQGSLFLRLARGQKKVTFNKKKNKNQ